MIAQQLLMNWSLQLSNTAIILCDTIHFASLMTMKLLIVLAVLASAAFGAKIVHDAASDLTCDFQNDYCKYSGSNNTQIGKRIPTLELALTTGF